MKAMPRNRLIVPMVTTIEGSRSRVTRKPLKAPQARPDRCRRRPASGVSAPACSASPIAVEASAMMAATERSISPEMMSSAMASAISAFSVKLKVASESDQGVRK
jgi:hypothetical protein